MSEQAVIRDQGYTSYDGPRAPELAWLVLARHTARSLWERRGVRRAIIASFIPALIAGVVVFIAHKTSGNNGGVRYPLLLLSNVYGVIVPALVIALAAAGGTLAEDRRAGALSFYFARPLHPDAYLFGRWLGVFAVVGVVVAGSPLVLSLYQLTLLDNLAQLPRALAATLMVAGLGAAMATVLTSYALLGGALARSRGAAQSFVALAFVLPWICAGVGAKLIDGAWVSLLSLPHLVMTIGRLAQVSTGADIAGMLVDAVDGDMKGPPIWAALVALFGIAAGTFVLLRSRTARLGASGGEGGDA